MNPWMQDLKFLLEQIKIIHPQPYHHNNEEQWNKVIAEVHSRLNSDIPDHIKITEYFKIIALLSDAHSRLALQFSADHQNMVMAISQVTKLSYPVRYRIFADGVYIIRAVDPDHLGLQIVSINNLPIASVVQQLHPYLPVENEIGTIAYLPMFLQQPLFLEAIGLIHSAHEPIQLEATTGKTVLLTPEKQPQCIDIFDWQQQQQQEIAQEPLPNYLSSDQELSIRTENDMVVVRISSIEDSETMTMTELAKLLDTTLTRYQPDTDRPEGRIQKLVIDLRGNGGGNNYLNMSLLRTIIKHSWIDQPNRIFVLIDRWTFSAAINLANDLERYTWAMFVGEPFNGRVNHYGDSTKITLPNSGIIARISSLYWQDSVPVDRRLTILPDISAAPSFAEYTSRIDTGLRAIENFDGNNDWLEFAKKYSTNYKIHRESQHADISTVFGSQPNITESVRD